MKFKKWVLAQGGPKAVGRLLNVNQFTVYAWFRQQTTPRAKLMQKLVKLGKGKFTYADIIIETKSSRGWK